MRMIFLPSGARACAILICSLLILTGCGENLDTTTPEGAFNVFKNAMFDGNPDVMWERMSQSSQGYFDEQLQRLNAMDEKIERFLPPTDHRIARRQAGTVLTDEFSTGKELFLHVFRPDSIPDDEKFRVGMHVAEIKISEDERQAAVVTRGEQEILLVESEGGEWHVMFVESSEVVPNAMAWLDSNEDALDQTIEDLISEERSLRAEIISELFGYESP